MALLERVVLFYVEFSTEIKNKLKYQFFGVYSGSKFICNLFSKVHVIFS